MRLPATPAGVIFVPALLDRSWREVFAGVMSAAGFLVLAFPLSFSLLSAVFLAAMTYVALRLLLTPTREAIEPAPTPIPAQPMVASSPALPTNVPVAPDPATLVVPPRGQSPFGLTRREVEILPLLARRLTDHEIAELLSISERTVMNHVASILGKLGLKSRREVAAFIEQHRDQFRFLPPSG